MKEDAPDDVVLGLGSLIYTLPGLSSAGALQVFRRGFFLSTVLVMVQSFALFFYLFAQVGIKFKSPGGEMLHKIALDGPRLFCLPLVFLI